MKVLPPYKPVRLTPTLSVQAPLTRTVSAGPRRGLLLIQDAATPGRSAQPSRTALGLDPEPLQKWAEEGFAAARIELSGGRVLDEQELEDAMDAIEHVEGGSGDSQSPGDDTAAGHVGVIVYSPSAVSELADALTTARWKVLDRVKAVVFFGAVGTTINKPYLCHSAGDVAIEVTRDGGTYYRYPEARSPSFVLPSHPHYLPASAAVSHSRSLQFLKKHLDGPWFDLEAVWDEHTRLEFADRAVDETMDTMVAEPYVNHVPTMTGGIGRRELTGFYARHFIFGNPDDAELRLTSRTVGVDRVVDEFVFALTHDRVIDWLLPGIPPTGKKLRIPFTAVVNIRGDRLYHEHIAWDQLTVLFQLGLMPEYLPFPYAVDGYPTEGTRLEYRVPGAGHEVADKFVDESAVPSNKMFDFAIREVRD